MTPDFSGEWQANLELSRFLGPTPKATVVSILHLEPILKADMRITKEDGTVSRLEFQLVTTGNEVINKMQGVKMRSRAQWIGEELEIESWMRVASREAHFRDYWSLRGPMLVMEHRNDDLAGQITFWERGGSPQT